MKWWSGCLALLLCLCGHALAAPQINWGETLTQAQREGMPQNLEIDLRQRWESTFVSDVKEPNEVPLDPEQVWAWPAQRFATQQAMGPVFLQNNQRMITRITVFSERLASDFSISVKMPRLDMVHVSYRYDGGAWTTLSAGDRLPMDRWPLADRQPSVNVPLPPGQLDVVMQFAHRGMMDAPTLLQNNRAFLQSRTQSIWLVGLAMGINVVMGLMGVLLALNFQKSSFLAVSAMSTIMTLVLMFSSGLGGMIILTDSHEFNDQIKFISNTVWGALLPIVFSVALGIRAYSKRCWWLSIVMSAAGVLLSFVLSRYAVRDDSPVGIGIVLVVTSSFVVALLAWAWLKNYSRNVSLSIGLLLYAGGVFLLFSAYIGMLSSDASGLVASITTTLASLAMMRGLFLQYRMGRQVIARANTSPHRDVLTGLLNREGMQAHLYKVRERLQTQETCAIFIYISVLDTKAAMDEHGEQGFEMGMVQMAASLSTSVTGADGVARISGHAFGITVLMPPEPAMAIRMAQKILSRLMVLASHGAAMASTARISLAWMPLNGFRVDTMERRCVEALALLEAGKRIGWVGGIDSHKDASQLLRDSSLAPSTPDTFAKSAQARDSSRNGAASNLYDRIHRIEREMLHGVDTQFLVEEADRLSQALNSALPGQDNKARDSDAPQSYQPTQQSIRST